MCAGLAARGTILTILAVGCAVFAQQPQSASTKSVADYRLIVATYPRNHNDAIQRMLAMADADVNAAIRDAARTESGWTPQQLDAAMLVHTEAALFLFREHDDAAGTKHLRRAQDLGDAAARDPENSWFVRRWYDAITDASRAGAAPGAYVLATRLPEQVWYRHTEMIDRARHLERAGASPGAFGFGHHATDAEVYEPPAFLQAVSHYESVLIGRPALLIAAVHLGRLQMLRGRDADARRLFESAAAGSTSSVTRYLAHLFLGSLDERDGHVDAAERHYRAALDAVPGAQSGRVALAALLARTGRGAQAEKVLSGPGMDAPAPRTFDPWWAYLPGDERDFAVILAELRTEIRQ